MNPTHFLILNLAPGFYNLGTIWAHEVDIFRNWQALDPENSRGSVALIWYHPASSPGWGIWSVLGCQVASHALTALKSGRGQAKYPGGDRGHFDWRDLGWRACRWIARQVC